MTGLDLLLHTENLRREIIRRETRIATLRRLAGASESVLLSDRNEVTEKTVSAVTAAGELFLYYELHGINYDSLIIS